MSYNRNKRRRKYVTAKMTPANQAVEVTKAAKPQDEGRYFVAGNGRSNTAYSDPNKNQMRSNYNYWLLYRQYKWIQRGVDSIARAGSHDFRIIGKDGSEVDAQQVAPIYDFLNRPNLEDTSFNQVLFKVIRDLLLFGVSFLELRLATLSKDSEDAIVSKALSTLGVTMPVDDGQTIPSQQGTGIPNVLKVIPAWTMEVVADKRGNVQGYIQHVPQGGDDIPFGADEIVRIVAPHSMDPLYGDSALSAIVLDASIGIKISQRQYAKLENEVAFDKAFILKNGGERETKRFRENVLNEYTGAKAAGNFLVISDDTDVKDLSNSKDGDYLALSNDIMESIAKALGVPLAILGSDSGNALSDGGHDGAWQLFIENTVEPLVQHVQKSLTYHVIRLFSSVGLADYELDIVTESKNDDSKIEEKYDKMLRNGTKTPNEIRQLRGDEPYEGYGDKPLVYTASGATPLEDVENPPEPPAPVIMQHPGMPGEEKPEAPVQKTEAYKELRSTLRAIRKTLE